ncbi:MAG: hypothetical protein KJ600_04220 [Nanoarchaeota archaeon]|nr:hypothetical protein [Nanoarchaeota archaeon]MBU1103733.1 hypothetical protein [Nanoarchaeota archaeon]
MIDRNTAKKKRPLSITLIIVWIILAIIRGVSKIFASDRIEINKQIFGSTFSFVNYGIDILILIGFVIFLFMFVKRKRDTWKYFIYFLAFLMIGVLTGTSLMFLNFEKFAELTVSASGKSLADILPIFLFISPILVLGFYALVMYFVKKNRIYFEK